MTRDVIETTEVLVLEKAARLLRNFNYGDLAVEVENAARDLQE